MEEDTGIDVGEKRTIIASGNFEEHNRLKQAEKEKMEQEKLKREVVSVYVKKGEELTSEEMERVAEWAEEVKKKRKNKK